MLSVLVGSPATGTSTGDSHFRECTVPRVGYLLVRGPASCTSVNWQTLLENHDATNSPHDPFAVTTNNYKPVCSNYKQVLSIPQMNAFSARKELRASRLNFHHALWAEKTLS